MVMIVALVILWVACGVYAYGTTFAYFDTEYPWVSHHSFAFLISLGGIVAAVVTLFLSNFNKHGWRLR